MTPNPVQGNGTREQPWQLTTPSGTSEYQMYRDETANPPALVCTVGKTELRVFVNIFALIVNINLVYGDSLVLR